MSEQTQGVIAVANDEMNQFGCPHCGYRSGTMPIQGRGSAVWRCGECGKQCCILAEGLTKSTIGFGDTYPELVPHPRRGTPAHGRPDTRPEGGGEYFRSRGVGLDHTPGCFICGGEAGLHNNISAFVQCKPAGERVVAMFEMGARLDYRDFEPDRVQVKVGACDTHEPRLQKLHVLTSEADGILTPEHIRTARAGT